MDEDQKLADYIKELGDGLRQKKGLTGDGGVLTPLIKQVFEASLEGKLNHPRSSGFPNPDLQGRGFGIPMQLKQMHKSRILPPSPPEAEMGTFHSTGLHFKPMSLGLICIY